MIDELDCDALRTVIGGSLLRSPSLLTPSADPIRPLSQSFDALSFALPRVGGSSLGGDEPRLRMQPVERRPLRHPRGTVSTTIAVSHLPGSAKRPARSAW